MYLTACARIRRSSYVLKYFFFLCSCNRLNQLEVQLPVREALLSDVCHDLGMNVCRTCSYTGQHMQINYQLSVNNNNNTVAEKKG